MGPQPRYRMGQVEAKGIGSLSRRKKRPLTPEQARRLIGRLRIGDLNKLFGHRYGGGRHEYVFPDDDAGREDLIILLQHYSRTNPLKVLQIVKLRAPWMGEDEIARVLDRIVAYPRQWKAETLGRELRVTKADWRQLDLRTIAPADMTIEERKQERKLRAQLHRRLKRREQGMKSRAEFLAANSISRTKPWEAEGISRKTWYKRRQKQPREGGDRSVPHKDVLNAADAPVTPSKPPVPRNRVSEDAQPPAPEVSQAEACLTAEGPCLQKTDPSLTQVCVP